MKIIKKHSVLIVDDEKLNIIALTSILGTDYRVLALIDSREALEVAEKEKPDVIVLDILMPEMDGYEVITELKKNEHTKDIPVIFITGLDTAASEEKALRLGAADYITKPFNTAIVKLRIKNQIELNLKEALRIAKDQAEHSNRVKSEFLSRMSHEMLTPMNAIMGMLQIAKLYPERQEECVLTIESSSKELLTLINDLLDVSDIEFGTLKLSTTIFSFKTMLHAVLKKAVHYANLRNQFIDYTIDSSIPSELIGDEKLLSKVVYNLLVNAVKYSPENSEINFKASLEKDDEDFVTIRVIVIDNGIGISEEQKKNIFDIFEQADGSNSAKQSGLGIGLALSKRILSLMDGNISVDSELGKGAKFEFTCTLEKA
ncbi:MAG: response regulator [Oscillospiraceae bacterium]|nr:response regulator [Oscillospiraceae bacterium]